MRRVRTEGRGPEASLQENVGRLLACQVAPAHEDRSVRLVLLRLVLARRDFLDSLAVATEDPLEKVLSARGRIGERSKRILGHCATHEHRTILSEEAYHAFVAIIDRTLRFEGQRHWSLPKPVSQLVCRYPFRRLSTLSCAGT